MKNNKKQMITHAHTHSKKESEMQNGCASTGCHLLALGAQAIMVIREKCWKWLWSNGATATHSTTYK